MARVRVFSHLTHKRTARSAGRPLFDDVLLIFRGDVLTEVLFAQLLEGAVGAEFVDGVVDGFQQGGAGIALAQGDGHVRGLLGLGDDLEVGVRMDVQIVVEGDVGVQGRVDAAGGQQLDGLFQRVVPCTVAP